MGEHPAMFLREIEIIHRAGDVEIRVGIEPVGERQPLMAQIAFDLKIGVEPEGLGSIWFSWAILELAAEFGGQPRSEEHTSELQSLMRISYAVFCLKNKKKNKMNKHRPRTQSKNIKRNIGKT